MLGGGRKFEKIGLSMGIEIGSAAEKLQEHLFVSDNIRGGIICRPVLSHICSTPPAMT